MTTTTPVPMFGELTIAGGPMPGFDKKRPTRPLTLAILDGRLKALEEATRQIIARVETLETVTETDRFEERLAKVEVAVGMTSSGEEPQKPETE